MRFTLTLLGTGSALPLPWRFTTSQVLEVEGDLYLFDCGEGVQVRLRQCGLKAHRIRAVFISHLHGDHLLGLIGLLNTYALQGREAGLEVFGPPGLREIVAVHRKYGQSREDYPIRIHELNPEEGVQPVLESKKVLVRSIPLQHRIPALGYLLAEKARPRNIRPEWIKKYDLKPESIVALKSGEAVRLEDGTRISPEAATDPSPPPRSFAFLTDTTFLPELAPQLQGVDLLYHESTFCEAHRDLAGLTGHSTAAQAAEIARRAGAGTLLLGHFSSRYPDLQCFEQEARAIFPATYAGRDGMQIDLPFRAEKPQITYLLPEGAG